MVGFKSIIAVLLLLAMNIGCTRQVDILKSGVGKWNKWREEKSVKPNLAGAHLEKYYLEGADLHEACLVGAHLDSAYLVGANLRGADLHEADLRGANLERARLGGANLRGADLNLAFLPKAHLDSAHLDSANLRGAVLEESKKIEGLGDLFYDVTNKPPGTIEWE